jgi:hypothetical protein
LKLISRSKAGKIGCCKGKVTIESGILSMDCNGCHGRMEIWHPECFIGLSDGMIPGYRGSVVLKGDIHRSYDGPIVDTVSTHSQIRKDIRNLGGEDSVARKKLRKLVSEIEKELISDPIKLIERKDFYLNNIRKTLRKKDPPEAERFLSIVASTTKLVRRLERGVPKDE